MKIPGQAKYVLLSNITTGCIKKANPFKLKLGIILYSILTWLIPRQTDIRTLKYNLQVLDSFIYFFFISNRADSSAAIQAHCSMGLGIILQKLYKENVRYRKYKNFLCLYHVDTI